MPSVRKLAAIVFTDIVGYTAQMGRDEELGLQLLQKKRELIYPLTKEYSGTVLKELGDGMLLSFDNSLNAVSFAMELQKTLAKSKMFKLRIGIHTGDVVFENNDVFGDGVNIAARIQPIAAPGGICISKTVYEQLQVDSEIEVADIGKRKLKGVAKLRQLYAVRGEGIQVQGLYARYVTRPIVQRSLYLFSLLAFATAIYVVLPYLSVDTITSVPSLGVLQVKNLGEKEDDARSYGMLQDMIIDMTNTGGVQVVPALEISVEQIPLHDLAKKLRVRYLFQGTMNRLRDSVFINSFLFDARENKNTWAERINVPSEQFSTLSGKIREALLGQMHVTSSQEVQKELAQLPTENAQAYELYIQAKYRLDKAASREDVLAARSMFQQAFARDPTFVRAKVGVGQTFEVESELDSARVIYGEALSLSRIVNRKVDQSSIIKNIGNLFYREEKFAEALDMYNQAMALAKEHKNKYEEALLLMNLGLASDGMKNYKQAFENYTTSRKLFQQLKDETGEAKVLNNIGNLYSEQGDYANAKGYFEQALQFHKKSESKENEASTLSNLAAIYWKTGGYATSEQNYLQCIEIYTALGNTKANVNNNVYLGLMYAESNQLEKAKERFTQSLKTSRELADSERLADCYYGLGMVFAHQRNQQKAKESFLVSYDISFKIQSDASLEPFSWLALTEAKLGNKTRAISLSDSAESIIAATPDFEGEVIIFWNLSQAYSLAGNKEKAQVQLTRAKMEIDTRAGKISNQQIRDSFRNNVQINKDVLEEWKRKAGS